MQDPALLVGDRLAQTLDGDIGKVQVNRTSDVKLIVLIPAACVQDDRDALLGSSRVRPRGDSNPGYRQERADAPMQVPYDARASTNASSRLQGGVLAHRCPQKRGQKTAV